MSSIEQEAIRIGWQLTRGLAETIQIALSAYRHGTKADRSAKKLQNNFKGEKYSQRDKFVTASMHKTGNIDFEKMQINQNDVRKFDYLCKQYGVDYLYETKPKIDIQAIINKADKNKSEYEKSILKNWTEIDENGKTIPTLDDIKITFRVQDIQKMEFVVDDLLKHKEKLQERIKKAKSTQKKFKREKDIDKSKFPITPQDIKEQLNKSKNHER